MFKNLDKFVEKKLELEAQTRLLQAQRQANANELLIIKNKYDRFLGFPQSIINGCNTALNDLSNDFITLKKGVGNISSEILKVITAQYNKHWHEMAAHRDQMSIYKNQIINSITLAEADSKAAEMEKIHDRFWNSWQTDTKSFLSFAENKIAGMHSGPVNEAAVNEKKAGLPQDQKDLMEMIKQLKTILEEREQYIAEQKLQINNFSKDNEYLQSLLKIANEQTQESRQDKIYLKDHIESLKQSNIAKDLQIAEFQEKLEVERKKYELLMDQFNLSIAQKSDGENGQAVIDDNASQLSGVSSYVNIDPDNI